MTTELLQESFTRIINNALSDLHTSMPGVVVKYDHTNQKADIKPTIKRKLNNDQVLDIPIIPNVPILIPETDDFIMHYPIKAGNYVLLIFCERSIDNFITDGSETPPNDKRKHDLSDAVAIPFLKPFSEKSLAEDNKNFYLKFKNGELKITPTGEIVLKNSIGNFRIDSLGRIGIGTATAELLQLFDLTLDALLSDTVITPPTKALLTTIKTLLLTIKGGV